MVFTGITTLSVAGASSVGGWDKQKSPIWTAFKLIIPIDRPFYLFESWSVIGRRAQASGVALAVPVATQVIAFFLANILWPLPYDIWIWLFIAGCASVGTINAGVAYAERIDEPDYRWPALEVAEWIVLVVGSLFYMLVVIGLATDFAANVDWNFAAYALATTVATVVVFQLLFARLSRPVAAVAQQ